MRGYELATSGAKRLFNFFIFQWGKNEQTGVFCCHGTSLKLPPGMIWEIQICP